MTQARMFGNYLRERRKHKGISLHVLAARAKVSVSVLSRIENGKHDPRLTTVHRIAKFGFKQTAAEFLGGYIKLDPASVVEIQLPERRAS